MAATNDRLVAHLLDRRWWAKVTQLCPKLADFVEKVASLRSV